MPSNAWEVTMRYSNNNIEYTVTYSTHSLNFAIRLEGRSFRVLHHPVPPPCILVVAHIAERHRPVSIPCFECSLFPTRQLYLEYYKHLVRLRLFSRFTSISPCCARKIARKFSLMLEWVNDQHQCPPWDGMAVSRNYVLKLDVQVTMSLENRVLLESFDEAEDAAPQMNPTSTDVLHSLVTVKDEEERLLGDWFEYGWTNTDCVICMDKIETRKSSLDLPCSHVFHKECLVRWLKTSHICPICRYELPFDEEC